MASTPKNTVYVIRCLQTGIHKIGITGNWGQRSRQLEVGSKTATVRVVRVNDGPQLEKWLHRRYKAVRLPQTEYFQLSAEQLEHVLAALDKAASDHRAACVRQQGDLTRPRYQARQRVISSTPAPATPAQRAASGPAVSNYRKQAEAAAADERIAALKQRAEQNGRALRRRRKRMDALLPSYWLLSFLISWPLVIMGIAGDRKISDTEALFIAAGAFLPAAGVSAIAANVAAFALSGDSRGNA